MFGFLKKFKEKILLGQIESLKVRCEFMSFEMKETDEYPFLYISNNLTTTFYFDDYWKERLYEMASLR